MHVQESAPSHKEWRSRDAADRLLTALLDPHRRPRWILEIKRSKHRRGKNPSVIVKDIRGREYKVKALRSEYILRLFKKDHPDSDVIPLAIDHGEPMSQIRERVYSRLDSLWQRNK